MDRHDDHDLHRTVIQLPTFLGRQLPHRAGISRIDGSTRRATNTLTTQPESLTTRDPVSRTTFTISKITSVGLTTLLLVDSRDKTTSKHAFCARNTLLTRIGFNCHSNRTSDGLKNTLSNVVCIFAVMQQDMQITIRICGK